MEIVCLWVNKQDEFYYILTKGFPNLFVKEENMRIKRKCSICGKEVSYLTRHIRIEHSNITEQEYYDRYVKQSNEGCCLSCKKPLKFKSIILGYGRYCGPKCEMASSEVKEKISNTYFEKTGYRHNWSNPAVIEKVKKTQEELYGGVGYASDKVKETLIENYNEKHGTNYDNIQQLAHSCVAEEKLKKTRRRNLKGLWQTKENQDKMVVSSKTEEAIEKRVATRRKNHDGKWSSEKHKEKVYELSLKYFGAKEIKNIDGTKWIVKECPICGKEYTINYTSYASRISNGINPCTNCIPIGTVVKPKISQPETEIYEYLKSMYDGKIEQSDKTILKGKELDIYLPDKKLAIEFDGLFWHNEVTKDNKYHLNKTEECEKKGIQLIHIFEDEWKYKQEIVKSRLCGLLGVNEKIYARKTICKEISYKEAHDFIEQNHIQGDCISKWRYGLFYKDELVSVMTFGKSRFKDEYELLRFANKLNTNVVGGAGKLFKHFMRTHSEIKEIISFADRRWSIGNLYEKLGFHLETKTIPSYYYIIDGICENRIKFQKHKLVMSGADPNKTEHEIMLDRGYYRIYDCGNLKYKYNI